MIYTNRNYLERSGYYVHITTHYNIKKEFSPTQCSRGFRYDFHNKYRFVF